MGGLFSWLGYSVVGADAYIGLNRIFPAPRQGTRALPYKMLGYRAGPMCPAAHRTPCKYPVIAKPVRTPAVAIRIPRPLGPLA